MKDIYIKLQAAIARILDFLEIKGTRDGDYRLVSDCRDLRECLVGINPIPSFKLHPKDVGKFVKLRGGYKAVIIEYTSRGYIDRYLYVELGTSQIRQADMLGGYKPAVKTTSYCQPSDSSVYDIVGFWEGEV